MFTTSLLHAAAAEAHQPAPKAAQQQVQPQAEVKAEVKQEPSTAEQAQQAQQAQHASAPASAAKLEFDASDDEEAAPKGAASPGELGGFE